MSRISVRGFAVASATAVTTVGAVVGVASGDPQTSGDDFEATAADMTLLADIPAGQQAQVQTASLTQQADAQASAADTTARKSAEESARLQAARDAKAKKQAAEDKVEAAAAAAAQKKKDEAERASRSEARSNSASSSSSSSSSGSSSSSSSSSSSFPQQSSYTVAEVQSIARSIVPADQFQCFSNIVDHESTWNYQAQNPSSGAYGLVQALPGSKMSSAGADWQTNPATQIKWGLNYMNERYDSPCGAWSFWQANNWY